MIIWQSPRFGSAANPGGKKTARHVCSGAKKGNLQTSPGENGASGKPRKFALTSELAVLHQVRVTGAECVMSRAALILRGDSRRVPRWDLYHDHEFVIGARGRNNLKSRPN
jgi:hypothetical protein